MAEGRLAGRYWRDDRGHCEVRAEGDGEMNTKKGAVKKSATKLVDFLDMEAHGL